MAPAVAHGADHYRLDVECPVISWNGKWRHPPPPLSTNQSKITGQAHLLDKGGGVALFMGFYTISNNIYDQAYCMNMVGHKMERQNIDG